MTAQIEEVKITTRELRSMITLKLTLPPMFRLRMILTVWLIKLASLIAWCDIVMEVQEGEKK